ncbi:GP88 family protein [Bythopirellula polymerisocia]|uniref:Gene product 88 domain-containing protein n=1 Tax=Bythopirellula polymerisocia TaxID=2528003 RepID=A0A5C6CAQ6_9BACT|nr:hypothetical protein [Bythopirellula polymerisocia]TWU21298.1 hypothetical protein Pla144_47080 [Bythopirellula polymerisocia]
MRYSLIGSNTKLAKQSGLEYLIAGLSLAPHRRGPENVCPEAGYCSAVCNLWFSGRTVTKPVRNAMINRSQLLTEDPRRFRQLLDSDLERFANDAKSKRIVPLFRPNVASDLDWQDLARSHPHISFYDYTKVRSRLAAIRNHRWPENYQLTYSVNERSHHRTIGSYLRTGFNVSTVYDTDYFPAVGRIDPLPESWRFDGKEWPVIDGDKHDIRLKEVDGTGVVVGLRFKGSRRLLDQAIDRGFVYAT